MKKVTEKEEERKEENQGIKQIEILQDYCYKECTSVGSFFLEKI
jgi:hypothetical protein